MSDQHLGSPESRVDSHRTARSPSQSWLDPLSRYLLTLKSRNSVEPSQLRRCLEVPPPKISTDTVQMYRKLQVRPKQSTKPDTGTLRERIQNIGHRAIRLPVSARTHDLDGEGDLGSTNRDLQGRLDLAAPVSGRARGLSLREVSRPSSVRVVQVSRSKDRKIEIEQSPGQFLNPNLLAKGSRIEKSISRIGTPLTSFETPRSNLPSSRQISLQMLPFKFHLRASPSKVTNSPQTGFGIATTSKSPSPQKHQRIKSKFALSSKRSIQDHVEQRSQDQVKPVIIN